MSDQGLSYTSAGVNIDTAQAALKSVTEQIKETHNENVLGGIGGFGAIFNANFSDLQSPALVSSIDGVGTKTIVAQMVGDYSNIGHDIVNHCVNDILCQGARPLFFLDYFGCANLDAITFNQIVASAAEACKANNCALIGGETAEMPGVYHDHEIDIVGTIVGITDATTILPRGMMKPNDRLIGLASNGLHTNGYSLARKALFEHGNLSVRDTIPGSEDTTIGQALLAPHTSYFNAVYPLIQEFPGLLAAAHITGGGIHDNLIRVLHANVQAKIIRRSWTPLPIFQLIQETGNISDADMLQTFNMGIGMILVVDQEDTAPILERLNASGVHAAEIGKLQSGPQDVQIV